MLKINKKFNWIIFTGVLGCSILASLLTNEYETILEKLTIGTILGGSFGFAFGYIFMK